MLIASMGLTLAATFKAPATKPERLAHAPVVVRPDGLLRVETQHAVKAAELPEPVGLPEHVVVRVRQVADVVEDRSFPVRLGNQVEEFTGHGWGSATLAPYTLRSGHPPRDGGEIVVSSDIGRIGQHRIVYFGATEKRYTIVGLVGRSTFESPVFFADSEAARISPRIDALAAFGPVEPIEKAVDTKSTFHSKKAAQPQGEELGSPTGMGIQVLTGDKRALAEPRSAETKNALVSINALIGTAGGVSAFTAIFVVASTFTFAVSQRRREFALLRSIGASKRNIKNMLRLEAAVLALFAGVLGCVAAVAAAGQLEQWLIDLELAPPWFHVKFELWPLIAAMSVGVLISQCGVWVAARQASKTQPIEALREATIEKKVMNRARWIIGATIGIGTLGVLAYSVIAVDGHSTGRKQTTVLALLLILAAILLLPALMNRTLRIIEPLARKTLLTKLAHKNAHTMMRRTASTAAPVMVTIALATAFLGAVYSKDAASTTEVRNQLRADYVVEPNHGLGLAPSIGDKLNNAGLSYYAPSDTRVFHVEEGTALLSSPALAVNAQSLSTSTHLRVKEGSLGALNDNTIIVDEEWGIHVGEKVRVWRADGTAHTLRVAAVVKQSLNSTQVFVTPANGGTRLPERGFIHGSKADIARALEGESIRIISLDAWVDQLAQNRHHNSSKYLLVVLGITLIYLGLGIVNTLTMSTARRKSEFAGLRLSGLTRGLTVTNICAEAVLVISSGTFLGILAASVGLLSLWLTLALIVGVTPLVLPWVLLSGVAGACLLIGVFATCLTTLVGMRGRPITLLASRS
ncbi:MAG: ABC transporter permease [Corynebacteriales bacterium]|nr:ABC transporter permease [Mycobacteriales bacterium]